MLAELVMAAIPVVLMLVLSGVVIWIVLALVRALLRYLNYKSLSARLETVRMLEEKGLLDIGEAREEYLSILRAFRE